MVIYGRAVSVFGLSAGLTAVLSGIISPLSIFGATLFIGLGNGMSVPSCNVGVMNVKPDLAGSASGLNGAMGVGTGALLATIMGALLTESNGAYGFLTFLLVAKLISLLAALYIYYLDKKIQNSNYPS